MFDSGLSRTSVSSTRVTTQESRGRSIKIFGCMEKELSPLPSLSPRYPRVILRTRWKIVRDLNFFLDKLHRRSECGLHLGAGASRIEGLKNCDLYHPDADEKVDCRDLSRFADASVDLIETHHMIEHLSLADADRAIGEWARVMMPGGFLILTCPDINRVCLMWLSQSIRHAIAFGPRARERASAAREEAMKMLVGPQNYEGMVHQSAYDRQRLVAKLRLAGFIPEFCYTGFPDRPTPSLLVIARRAITTCAS